MCMYTEELQNAKIDIRNINITFNVSILLRFGKKENQYVSKACFKFYAKIINDIRATVYQIAMPSDSEVAI